MSKATTLLILVVFLTINTIYAQESHAEKFKKLEWLIGKWLRTNAKAGESGYETWTKSADLKLSGKGITMRGKEQSFVENLEFLVKGNDIYYAVMIAGEKKPTYFKLTDLGHDGFTCENPQHDFPKKISYQRKGNNLKAVISGNGKSIDYNFIKDK